MPAFELKRTTATFGVFHPREEKNKGMAVDIPFRVTIGSQYLSMLAPPQLMDGEVDRPDIFINELWTPEGYVRRPSLSPIKIHRKPEGALVTIHDIDADRRGLPLQLKPCRLNKLECELQSPHLLVLSGQIQYSQYNDLELTRINALSGKTFDLSIFIEQNDLFEANEKKDEAGDESGAEAEEQTEEAEA